MKHASQPALDALDGLLTVVLKRIVSAGAVGLSVAAAILFWPSNAVHAQVPPGTERVGTVYEIRRDVKTSEESSTQSGTSTDRDTYLERVTGIRDDGLEFEYDLPRATSARERAINWRFPVRVFRPTHGKLQLLNGPELETRIDDWLKQAGLPRTACGHWYVTWNAFQVVCDPQSAIQAVEGLDLRLDDMRDGALYRDSQSSGSTTLKRAASDAGGYTFAGEMAVDPEQVRQAEAQSDVIGAELTKKSLTLADALLARSTEKISGTTAVTIDVDPAGFVQRRTKLTKIEVIASNGLTSRRTTTEVIDRRLANGSFKSNN